MALEEVAALIIRVTIGLLFVVSGSMSRWRAPSRC
jgi:hypothetical protein